MSAAQQQQRASRAPTSNMAALAHIARHVCASAPARPATVAALPATVAALPATVAAEASGESPSESIEHSVSRCADLSLLSDRQMRSFIAAGFLTLRTPELPASFHAALYERASRVFGPGSPRGMMTNVAVGITAELQQLLRSPSVAGALVSLLGPGFTFGHLGSGGCALHCSAVGAEQVFHKDSQRSGVNGHRTRAVMVFYYPGFSSSGMGPTACVPTSHLLAPEGLGLSLGVMEEGTAAAQADQDDWSGVQHPAETSPALAEHRLVLPHGAGGGSGGGGGAKLVLVHEDLVHRATAKLESDSPWRPLFKFTFTRTCQPSAPSWDHQGQEQDWQRQQQKQQEEEEEEDPHEMMGKQEDDWPGLAAPAAWPACEAVWRWHLGTSHTSSPSPSPSSSAAAAAVDVAGLGARLLVDRGRDMSGDYEADEAERTAAAYQLGMFAATASAAAASGGGSSGEVAAAAEALGWLEAALCLETNESARRAGAHGLAAAGDCATPTILQVLQQLGQRQQQQEEEEEGEQRSQQLSLSLSLSLSLCCVGSAVEALGEAAITPTLSIILALHELMTTQSQAIAQAPQDEQPDFDSLDPDDGNAGDYGKGEEGEEEEEGSFLADTLQVPVLLPVRHRVVALRYLIVTVAQTALGRIAQRCTAPIPPAAACPAAPPPPPAAAAAAAAGAAGHEGLRMAVLDALRPWSRSVCPRTREENSKAMLSLCVAAATAAAAGAAGAGVKVGAAERDALVEGVVGTLPNPAEREFEGQDSGAININGNASESYALEALNALGV